MPAERQFDLLYLGCSYDEVRQVRLISFRIFYFFQISDIFDHFKNEYKEATKNTSVSLTTLLQQFSNFISTNALGIYLTIKS